MFICHMSFFIAFCSHSQISIQKEGSKWQLSVDGEPFPVKGVTFGYDQEPVHFGTHFKALKKMGVNTIRLWATNEYTPILLINLVVKYSCIIM